MYVSNTCVIVLSIMVIHNVDTPSYVTCKTGVCKNKFWDCSVLICSYTRIARHTCSPVQENDVKKKVLHIYVTVCNLMSKVLY